MNPMNGVDDGDWRFSILLLLFSLQALLVYIKPQKCSCQRWSLSHGCHYKH